MNKSGKASRGRPPKITDTDITRAVLQEGFAGLTVPAVAARLGVSTVTLYRHVPNRAELLALAWGHILEEVEWPGLEKPWRVLLVEYPIRLWDLLAEHPGAVSELSGAVLPAEMMHLYNDLAEALTREGFSAADAVLAVDSVIDLTVDHRRGVEHLSAPVDGIGQTMQEQITDLWSGDRPVHPGDVHAAMQNAIGTEPRDWFLRKLGLLLDGIATRRDGEHHDREHRKGDLS